MTSRKLTPALLVVLTLVLSALSWVVAPPRALPSAEAATSVGKDVCRRIDPNLVNGVCLRYGQHGSGLTWIGTYRAPNGRVFFCIDFLYDSRLPRRSRTVSTRALVNQLGRRVGDREVAALNYVISTWAGHGSTGSDSRDAAIALIVREVMGDGLRRGGVEVYPRGLDVGKQVRAPIGGLPGPVLGVAREMWRRASQFYGPYRVELTGHHPGPLRLGRSRGYRVAVRAASGRLVPDVPITLSCRGPVVCPLGAISGRRPVRLSVEPARQGRFRIRAGVSGPSSDGLLYRAHGWHTHGGPSARGAGVQRGWIAQRNASTDVVADKAVVVRARPRVSTVTSDTQVTPGAQIHDLVRVRDLPRGHRTRMTATLYGPFRRQPGLHACRPSRIVGRVHLDVGGNGRLTTPSVTVAGVGRYTWVESLPGDDQSVTTRTRCGLVEETTTVVPFTPRLHTRASTRHAQVDGAVRDTVTVEGIASSPVRMRWQLLGPVPARRGSCADVSWRHARVDAHGAMDLPGVGTYRTPRTRLRHAGCYTYVEQLVVTPLTYPAASPPGLTTETVLVERRTPTVSTTVSRQRAQVGARLHDAVRVRGLGPRRAVVDWSLLGPVAPRRSSCRGLHWTNAPTAGHGRLSVRGDGVHRTPSTQVALAGCYTYVERLRGTPDVASVLTPPGQVAETTVVTRPVTPYVPEVPSGAARGGRPDGVPHTRAEPRYLYRTYVAPEPFLARRVPAGQLSLPRIGLHAPVAAVGLDAGTMAIPNDRHVVGWLSTTAAPGDRMGASVISGHVSDRHDRPGALGRLRDARRGDLLRWRGPDGVTHRFVVRSVRHFPRRHGLPRGVFANGGRHVLHVVTCADRHNTGGGRFHYADNLVVTAVETGR